MALSPSVAARHSRMPVSSDRSAAGDDPVPGLLNDRNVVVPPNAAATESTEEAIGFGVGRDARVGVDVDRARQDQEPGRVDHLVGPGREARQVGLDGDDPPAVDRDDRPAGSRRPSRPSRRGSSRSVIAARASTAGPGLQSRPDPRRAAQMHRVDRRRSAPERLESGISRTAARRRHRRRHPRSVHLADRDRLRALPQAAPAHLAQAIVPALVGDDRREMVRRQLADLGRRRAAAVREEDLALADAARVDRQLARRRVRGVVLVVEARAGSRRTGSTSTRRSSGSG